MKRFYKQVTAEPQGDGWQVKLDGRAVKTQGKNPQVVPSKALAEAMAVEWADQGDEIDTTAFPLRDLADFALDMTNEARLSLIEEIAGYAQTDTLCYRAAEGEALHIKQMEVWEPVLQAAERRWDVRFERISGIIHRPQPTETLSRMHAAVTVHNSFTLAPLRMLTGLSASLVIGLSAIEPDADADILFTAASVEEDWQAQLWGQDEEALEVREARFQAFRLAMQFVTLAKS